MRKGLINHIIVVSKDMIFPKRTVNNIQILLFMKGKMTILLPKGIDGRVMKNNVW